MSHILLVAVIGLIFIGPEELPQLLRTLAKFLGQLKRATDDITGAFHSVSEQGRDYVKEERRLMSETIHANDKAKPPAVNTAPVPPPSSTVPESDPNQLSLDINAASKETKSSGDPV